MSNYKTFSATIQRLRENGEFRPRNTDRGSDRTQALLDVETDILDLVEDNPGISVGRLA